MRPITGALLFVLFASPQVSRLEAQRNPPVIAPRLINIPTPDCGSGKSCHGAHGHVRLIVEVLANGSIGDMWAEKGDSRLVDAAEAAVQQAEFQPGRFQGQPSNMNFVLNLTF